MSEPAVHSARVHNVVSAGSQGILRTGRAQSAVPILLVLLDALVEGFGSRVECIQDGLICDGLLVALQI